MGKDGLNGEFLVLVAALVSIQMAQGRSTDEIDLLAAFFTVLGDNLALISTRRAQQDPEPPNCV
jgi:hypothetical protein